MQIVFFYYEDVMHHEYVPQGHTVNQRFCLQLLRCLLDTVNGCTSGNPVSVIFAMTMHLPTHLSFAAVFS